jgi:hypothetical protein
MDLEQDIDRAFNELIFKIEVLHKFIKATTKARPKKYDLTREV